MSASAPIRPPVMHHVDPVRFQKEWRHFTNDTDYQSEERLIDGSKEKPKVLFRTSINHALLQFSLFHVPPIAATLGLLSVYVLHISWDPGNDVLGTLLFAAKVHETAIIASLFHILYYHIRRGLLGPDGVPFGFLTAAFQLSSPFYLFNSSFIAPLLRYRPATVSSVVLAVLMVMTFLLAALAGASSGVVILPRFDWWTIELSKVNGTMSSDRLGDFTQLIVSPVDRLYPQSIDLRGYPQDCGNGLNQCDLASTAGYTEPSTFAWNWVVKDAQGIFMPPNITFDHRIMQWRDFVTNTSFATAATIPMYGIAAELSRAGGSQDRGWGANYPFPSRISPNIKDHAGQPLPTKQPRVAIQCTTQALLPQNNEGFYSFRMDPSPGLYPQLEFQVNQSPLASANASTRSFGFVDLNGVLPARVSNVLWIWDTTIRRQMGPALCFIDARWVESSLWLLPQTGDVPQFSYKIDKGSLSATNDVQDIIDLDLAWLESLADIPVIVPRNATSFSTVGMFDYMYQEIWDPLLGLTGATPENRQRSITARASFTMTITLTNLLSVVPRTSGHAVQATGKSLLGPFNATLLRQKTPSEGGGSQVKDLLAQPSFARIEPLFEHNIYEFNFEGRTTKLAWAVLLTHVLLVLIHFVVICVHGNWQSSAWSQLGELLAAAINSRPTELLRNTGVSVDDWKTWRLTAYARVSDDERVGFELRDKAASAGYNDNRRLPEANRAYG
ncbi:hypothetical protein QBC34DRAFT_417512 [Podospora aff. communis PSN243]|uniref:Uncharacterized protein n=1 Tax=Podospora aff. communis PSN243 TaxID=3040156 RepID=A0AAV9G7U7_9PEZI|nr:hypothetical protein QBC34DRAFT_417512 [Podospora aff. communis PSN243]